MVSNFNKTQNEIRYKTIKAVINEIAIILLCFLLFMLYGKIRLFTM